MVFKKEELNKFLYKASEKGDVKKVKALIKKKADVNAKIFRDRTPLHIAAVSGHAELAKLLIKKNAEVNSKDDMGQTPLHYASSEGHTELVKLLIAQDADISAKNNNNCTPLDLAMFNEDKSLDVVNLILDYVHIPQLEFMLIDAIECNHLKTAILLIERGADVNISHGGTAGIRTPLHLAVRLGSSEVVKLLIERGADLNATDDQLRTPLLTIFEKKDAQDWKTEMAIMLIEAGTDITVKDRDGNTLLHLAARQGNKEIGELLINRGADMHAKNKMGVTPLGIAAANDQHAMVEFLREHGAGE